MLFLKFQPRPLALFGIEELEVLAAEHLLRGVAENIRHATIYESRSCGCIHNPDALDGNFHHPAEPLFTIPQGPFGLLLFGYVPNERHHTANLAVRGAVRHVVRMHIALAIGVAMM